MAQLKLNIDADTFQRLLQEAVSERRPVNLQAEVILRQALGLPFPFPPAPLQFPIEKPSDGQAKAA